MNSGLYQVAGLQLGRARMKWGRKNFPIYIMVQAFSRPLARVGLGGVCFVFGFGF